METSASWEFESGSQYVRDADTGGTVLRVCEDDGHIDLKQAKPNDIDAIGSLAAAAPDLLEALKAFVALTEPYADDLAGDTDPESVRGLEVLASARAAIAKAEGTV
jgi:hypothetical protein